MGDGNDEDSQPRKSGKQHNVLPLWGNEASMNLNPLILTNIQSSSYFKVSLFKLKTYHEVVDEIYYQVKHLEPWEKGSRKTAGQTGMCGGVRGVGAGGIVSTAYCLLYKLYTLRLTRKQLNGLLTHTDSPYIRALGFMYIRYSQPPSDLYDWYEEYLQDEEEMDVKAGGGQIMAIGQMLRQWLVKLDWFSTLFPRIPVPIQKSIEKRLEEYSRKHNLDNRLTYAEKEMNKRRGEEQQRDNMGEQKQRREYYDDKAGGSSGNGGSYGAGSSAGRGRDYWAGSGGGGAGDSREYRDEHDRRRSRSRSRERSGRGDYHRERNDRDKYKERSRDKNNYRERERTDYRGSESEYYESAAAGSSGSSKSRDRNYR